MTCQTPEIDVRLLCGLQGKLPAALVLLLILVRGSTGLQLAKPHLGDSLTLQSNLVLRLKRVGRDAWLALTGTLQALSLAPTKPCLGMLASSSQLAPSAACWSSGGFCCAAAASVSILAL